MLANIVIADKTFKFTHFNVVQTLEDIIEGLPTLIIGYKKFIDNKFDYEPFEKKINNHTYWTFSPKEDRSEFNKDFYTFTTNAISSHLKNCKYHYIDPFLLTKKTYKKILKKLISKRYNSFIFNESMVFICVDNVILGVDLYMLDFLDVNRAKILNKISKYTNLLTDQSIFIEYKDIITHLSGDVKFIPYLYLIENGQKDHTANYNNIS